MIAFRLLRVGVLLFGGLAISALVFPFIQKTRRDIFIQRWSVQLVRICGIEVDIQYAAGAQHVARSLIVANHVSWLDIFVINSLQPCCFVAKSDIRDWPVLGWLCARAGTIFIARGKARDVRRIFKDLVASIGGGERVAFFPEGTTAAQGAILPFHANLFEAAIDAKVPVQPYALRYVDAQGELHTAVNFIGDMTFAQSMVLVLSARNVKAQIILLPLIDTTGCHRRELAAATRSAISVGLGYEL